MSAHSEGARVSTIIPVFCLVKSRVWAFDYEFFCYVSYSSFGTESIDMTLQIFLHGNFLRG